MKRLKCLTMAILIGVITIILSIPAFAGQWKQDNIGWWYQNNDKSYPRSSWQQVDNQWYHFDKNGYMQTGWIQEGDKWYFLNGSGVMLASTWVQSNGKWYYVSGDGTMLTNGITPEGHSVNVVGEWKNESADSFFCKNVYERYGDRVTVFAENGRDLGDYYEMDAIIQQGYAYETDNASYKTTIRIRKDATVIYTYSDRANVPLTLMKYAGFYSDLTLKEARLLETTHDSEGYIISFVDSYAW